MIGKTISHYKIVEHLGGGGMGIVYKAEDIKLKRTVALKFLSSELSKNEEAKNRFMHEAQAASALDHPRIGTIYEIDETDDGHLFIAMAYYEGETLTKKMERGPGPVPLEEALNLVIQIANGLAVAHEKGIVHRDIKPSNIMITKEGFVKIVDFGLAKLAGATKITKTGKTMGTPNYMSPEQVKGLEVDHCSDIWSLGVILYELLAQKPPFEEDYEMAVLYSIVNEEPVSISQIMPEVPQELEHIINKALKKDVKDRYASMQELLEALGRIQHRLFSESQSTTTAASLQETVALDEQLLTKGKSVTRTIPAGDENRTLAISSIDKKKKPPSSKKPYLKIIVPVALVLILVVSFGINYFNDAKNDGSIYLTSNPEGAQISLNDKPTGMRTPHLLGPLNPGRYNVALSLEGFERWTKELRVTRNHTFAEAVQLSLKQPLMGQLRVESNPSSAAISVDLEDSGKKTPALLENVTIGPHTIQLKKESFQTFEQLITISEKEVTEISATLSRAVGSLSVASKPSSAKIYLDGNFTGKTAPAKLDSIDTGTHNIQLKKEGYTNYEDVVNISLDKLTEISATLNKAVGSLFVDSTPQGAFIFLKAKDTGHKTPHEFTELTIRNYEVRLTLAGYLDNVTRVDIQPGKTETINVNLQVEPVGTLTVTAVIEEKNTENSTTAELWVDRKPYGQIPGTFRLASATYEISAKKFGYRLRKVEQKITIRGGKDTKLKFKFVKE